jgi:MMPL family
LRRPGKIFAFLFGLSMDYEVFILSRMREEYDRTGSTAYAVEHGLGRTGRLVTSAALILFFAFAALASTPGTDVKVMATALGIGILLDATIVRALLVPALVSSFGKYNWWLPAGIAKLLRVEPSPLKPDVTLPTEVDPLVDRPRRGAGSHGCAVRACPASSAAPAGTGPRPGSGTSCATRRCTTGWRCKASTTGLSQQAGEAEGSLIRETPGRVGAALTTRGRAGTARRPGPT